VTPSPGETFHRRHLTDLKRGLTVNPKLCEHVDDLIRQLICGNCVFRAEPRGQCSQNRSLSGLGFHQPNSDCLSFG
jgi:hypothetical protein